MAFVQLFILIALIKLPHSITPLVRALIYALSLFILNVFLSPFLPLLFVSIIAFFLVWLYFWLLAKTEGSFIWWIIMILGILAGAIIGLV